MRPPDPATRDIALFLYLFHEHTTEDVAALTGESKSAINRWKLRHPGRFARFASALARKSPKVRAAHALREL